MSGRPNRSYIKHRNISSYPTEKSSDDQIGNIDEPWDEKPAVTLSKTASPLPACAKEHSNGTNKELFDDGELPALSLNKKSRYFSILDGTTTTTKPLQPSSSADLGTSCWDDDMPDDEIMMGICSKIGETSPQSYEIDEQSNYTFDSHSQLVKSVSDENDPCDFANALDVCGKGGNNTFSPKLSIISPKVSLRYISDVTSESDVTVEQTAIEVEYSEPPKYNKEYPPTRKNTSTAVTARKMETGSRRTVQKIASPKVSGQNVDSAEDQKGQVDVYSSFSETEKRKFLKMVNSGMGSTESVRKVFEEREESKNRRIPTKQDGPSNPRRSKSAKTYQSPTQINDNGSKKFKNRDMSEAKTEVSPAPVVSEIDYNADTEYHADSNKKGRDEQASKKYEGVSISAEFVLMTAITSATTESKSGSFDELDAQDNFVRSNSKYHGSIKRDRERLDFIDDGFGAGSTKEGIR